MSIQAYGMYRPRDLPRISSDIVEHRDRVKRSRPARTRHAQTYISQIVSVITSPRNWGCSFCQSGVYFDQNVTHRQD